MRFFSLESYPTDSLHTISEAFEKALQKYNLRNQLHMPIASKIFSLSGQELTILERKKKCREPSFQEWLIIGVINKSIITK
jgi:hypothetical protein